METRPQRRNAVVRDWPVVNNTLTAGVSGKTIVGQFPSPVAYHAVQFFYANYATTAHSALTIAKCASAPTTGNNGSALSWTSITFNGAAGVTMPAGSGSGNDIIPSITASDIIQLATVERTDTAGRYMLQVRSYFDTSTDTEQSWLSSNPLLGYMSGLYPDMDYRFGEWANDAVTSPAVSKPPSTTGRYIVPVGVKFFTNSKCINIGVFGDSRSAGSNSTDVSGANYFYRNGWALRFQNYMAAKEVPAFLSNYALYGQTQEASLKSCRNIAPTLGVDYVTLFAMSPNDGNPTRAMTNRIWDDFLETVEEMRRVGIVVIGCTSPAFAACTTGDVYRIEQNNRMRELAALGVIKCADFDAVITNQLVNPALIKTEYDSDKTHMNNAGIDAMTGVMIKLFGSEF